MLRKLVSAFTVFALAVFGLSQVSTAQAATVSPVTGLDSKHAYGHLVALNDARAISIWEEQDDNGRYLKSGVLNSNGTFDNVNLITSEARNTYFSAGQNLGSLVTPEGALVIAWTKFDSDSSSVLMAGTSDGESWSNPVEVFADTPISGGSMCMMMECGFSNPLLAVDKTGLIALSVVFKADYGNQTQFLKTSIGGNSWSPSTVISNGNNFIGETRTLEALPNGGIMSTWTEFGNNDPVIKYMTVTGGAVNFWTRPKTLGTGNFPNIKNYLVQTDPTHMSLFFGIYRNSDLSIEMQKYNVNTGIWSTPVAVITAPNGYIYDSMRVDSNSSYVTTVAVGVSTNGTPEAKAYQVSITNSIPGQQSIVETNNLNQALAVEAVHTNEDGSSYLLVNGQTSTIAKVLHVVSGVSASSQSLTGLTGTTYGSKAVVSKNGTFFALTNNGTDIQAVAYFTASIPVATGTLSISGLSKIGKTLSAKMPAFGGVSGPGKVTVQWYACSAKIVGIPTSIPVGCVAIAKATSSKFKVTSKQKKKYLAIAVTSSNKIGATTLIKATSGKVS
jgi:hypothetical protein